MSKVAVHSSSVSSESSDSLSDLCSQSAFNSSKETFQNRQGKWGEAFPTLDHFYCQLLKTPTHILAISSDGIGSKVEIAERCRIYSTLGYDLMAMLVDDLICCGAEASHLSNVLDVDVLDKSIIQELFHGLKQAADEAQIMITGGETAELGRRVQGYGSGMHLNWCGTAIGTLDSESKIIDGSKIELGDKVLALRSSGMRSNGFTKARSILEKRFGDLWHEEVFDSESSWGEKLLTPSKIYAPHIYQVLQNSKVRGIAHITGGGIAGNLERILEPWNKGADLEDLFPPHREMFLLQEWAEMTDKGAYEEWNMGNGMLLVTSPDAVNEVLTELRERKIEAKISGSIVSKPGIRIQSKAIEQSMLNFSFENG